MTDYGYRYIRYDSDEGGILLHVYLRNVTDVNSPDKGKTTYKSEDVKDDLISKFKESKEWQLFSNKAIDSDKE